MEMTDEEKINFVASGILKGHKAASWSLRNDYHIRLFTQTNPVGV